MHTLVAGGCGFVGLNIAEAHLQAGEAVVLLDSGTPPEAAVRAFDALPGEWHHARADVTDAAAVGRVFGRFAIERVYYGAAVTSGAERERMHPQRVLAVNLLGLVHVIEAAARSGVQRMINLSSGAAYGEGGFADSGAAAPLDEQASRAEPSTLYGVTKLASEGVCRRMAELTGLDLVSVRLATVFGPWERDTGWRDTLSAPMQAAVCALEGRPATLARRDARDWTYSRDVARALRALMRAPGHRFDLYNLSAARTCSVLDLCDVMARHFPGFEYRLARAGEPPTVELHGDRDRLVMSSRRLRDDIGLTVPADIEAPVDDFARWIREHPDYWRAASRGR